MTDEEIVEALIAHDEQMTEQFFFTNCRPLILSVIVRVFDTQNVDYDEIISELYILLMENDAKRLRQFHFQSSLYQWLKVTAIRHCLRLKNAGRVIEDVSHEPLDSSAQCEPACMTPQQDEMDVEKLLSQMRNQRYAQVIRLTMLEGRSNEEVAQQLGVRVENLYNIKRRAIQALADLALNDKKLYEG